ncbi:MAG: sugar transferase [bacterium]
MRKSDIYFTAALVPMDYIAIVGAAATAYVLRYADFVQRVRPVVFDLPFREYFPLVMAIAAGWLVIFSFSGLYAMRERKFFSVVTRIALACSTDMLAVVLIFFFSRAIFSSRFMLLASWIFAVLYVGIERFLMRLCKRAYWARGKGLHEVVIVGNDAAAHALLASRFGSSAGGHHIAQRILHWDVESEKVLRTYIQAGNNIDELVLTDPDITRECMKSLIDFCTAHQVGFRYTAELLGGQTSNIGIDLIAGIPIIEVRATRLDGLGKVWKRLFDLCIATLGLLLLVPLTMVAGGAIILDSRGPVFVGLERIGARGKRFILYKYRSMIAGAHEMKGQLWALNERSEGPLFKMKHDPRVTRLGKFLRRWSIDELPQLWNVFKGEMSLVGPRPHEPQEVSQYETQQKKLLTIRPGITGLAQVSGRTDLSFAEEARIDTLYVEQWSMMLDIIIILKTPFVLFKHNGV